ncbi:hypothetical protein JOB18_038554 [Solea senegalensis]|nr:hypothetical protein JOB18_038554 [Solea senegalensis]
MKALRIMGGGDLPMSAVAVGRHTADQHRRNVMRRNEEQEETSDSVSSMLEERVMSLPVSSFFAHPDSCSSTFYTSHNKESRSGLFLLNNIQLNQENTENKN